MVPGQWLVAALTGAWGIWTWAHGQEQERQRKRAVEAALFVRPFLAACEDLQSRIYNIVDGTGLKTLRERYPDGSYAEETLYLLVRYLGWVTALQRYGPYTDDATAIRLATAVTGALSIADSDNPVGPFNIFQPEQRALGKMVIRRVRGQYGIELDTISYYEFKDRLKAPPLSESESINQSLDALRTAVDAASMSGSGRLGGVQRNLAVLLGYLEAREGYSLFEGERKHCVPLQNGPLS
ncbi:MAG: hypothetical protein GY703_21120 [Gammaproteobacteria bacterium]|nr:hypothetical protein [Gammaproteobacteria bacterium]